MTLMRTWGVVVAIAGAGGALSATAAAGSDNPLDGRLTAHSASALEFHLSGSTGIGRDAQVTLDAQGDAIRALSLDYTCTGKDIVNDSDLRTATLAKGRLPKPDARGRFHTTLKVHNGRTSGDNLPITLPDGKVVIDAMLRKSGKSRTVKGTFRIIGKHCSPPTVTFRVHSSGKDPIPQSTTQTENTTPSTA